MEADLHEEDVVMDEISYQRLAVDANRYRWLRMHVMNDVPDEFVKILDRALNDYQRFDQIIDDGMKLLPLPK